MSEHLDEPYTRITNEILEEIAKRRFNGTQYGIIISVLRNTYGFQRKSHRISISFLADATQCNKTQIKRELDKLIDMNVIKVYDEGTRVISREIGFNKHFGEWDLECTRNRVYANQSIREIACTVDTNPSTQGVRELEYQERNVFKESLKEITAITRPPEIELLDEFCDLHKKGDWNVKVKERTHMKMLLTDGVPLEYIITTMKKIYQRKTEEGERITSFVYYYEPILSAWNELQKGETGHAKDNAARNGHSRRNTTPSISDDELDELQRASNVYLLKVSGYGNDQ